MKLIIHIFALFVWHYVFITHHVPYMYLNLLYSIIEEQLWLVGLFSTVPPGIFIFHIYLGDFCEDGKVGKM